MRPTELANLPFLRKNAESTGITVRATTSEASSDTDTATANGLKNSLTRPAMKPRGKKTQTGVMAEAVIAVATTLVPLKADQRKGSPLWKGRQYILSSSTTLSFRNRPIAT